MSTVDPSSNVALAGARHDDRSLSAWQVIAIAAVVLGVFFRFYHIERKPLWDDEVITWTHVLGVSEQEVVSAAPGFRHVSDLREVLHPAIVSRPVSAVTGVLMAEDPQHPPLYYIIAHEWTRLFGTSLRALRLLSALFGMLAIPCAYWLCFELFESSAGALLGAALVALAPVAVLYSQEAREYSMWLVSMLVTSALFIRAFRSASLRAWSAYCITLAVSLYVFPLTMVVAAAQAIVSLGAHTSRRNRLQALAAIAIALALFAPWLVVILSHLSGINASMKGIVSARPFQLQSLRGVIALLRMDDIDFNGGHRTLARFAGSACVLILVYAMYAVRRLEPQASRQFIWALLACSTLPLVGLDFFLGGHRVAMFRYFMPAFLAFDLAMAALLWPKLIDAARPLRWGAWHAVFALVLALRLASCAQAALAPTWWLSYEMQPQAVAAQIDSLPRPLIISDGYVLWPLVLSEYLNPADGLALQPSCYLCKRGDTAPTIGLVPSRSMSSHTVVLVAPSKPLLTAVRAAMKMTGTSGSLKCVDVRNSCPGGYPLWVPGS